MSHPFSTATPQEFSAEARRLLADAQRVCQETPDSDLEQWMAMAKVKGMKWVEGLEWVREQVGKEGR